MAKLIIVDSKLFALAIDEAIRLVTPTGVNLQKNVQRKEGKLE